MESTSGRVLVSSSGAGKGPVHKMAAYSASKHAIHGFFGSLHQDLMWRKSMLPTGVIGRISTENANNALSGQYVVFESVVFEREKYYECCEILNSNTTLEHHARTPHSNNRNTTLEHRYSTSECSTLLRLRGLWFGCIEQISSDCVSRFQITPCVLTMQNMLRGECKQ